ncbi:MAG TPA: hypothetical protein VLL27_08770 [Solirubrobacterales bacterium]|nr:hypothetical protein [Solirubrobacterales bacterium]
MSDVDEYLGDFESRGFLAADAERFVATWERLETTLLERLARATGSADEWRDGFRAGATEVVDLVEANPREAYFLVVGALTAGELGRQRQRALGAKLATMLDAVRADLDDPEVVPPATARWIVGIFFDRIYRYCATGAASGELRSQLPELRFLAISAYLGTEAGLLELLPSE